MPIFLASGYYAAPISILSLVEQSDRYDLFAGLSPLTVASNDICLSDDVYVKVNGKTFTCVVDFTKSYAIKSNYAGNAWRFEVRNGDRAISLDKENRTDRSEIVGSPSAVPIGTTFWAAWSSAIITDYPNATTDIIVLQVHENVEKSPSVALDYGSGGILRITTRSAAAYNANGNGTSVVQYSADRPKVGVTENWVLQGRYGPSSAGFLNVWRNGTQVVSYNGPLGYYDQPDGRPWPAWGVYRKSVDAVFACEIYNPEWGTDDLSVRIANPLPISAF